MNLLINLRPLNVFIQMTGYSIHCNGPIKVSSTENKVREKGGKSATQLVLQCERMGCNALLAAMLHFPPALLLPLSLCSF